MGDDIGSGHISSKAQLAVFAMFGGHRHTNVETYMYVHIMIYTNTALRIHVSALFSISLGLLLKGIAVHGSVKTDGKFCTAACERLLPA